MGDVLTSFPFSELPLHVATAAIQMVRMLVVFYTITLVMYIAMSWLVQFRLIDIYKPAVASLWTLLANIHEPFLRPIRRVLDKFLPNMSGVDFSPLVALLIANTIVVPLAQRLILVITAMFYVS